MVAVSVAFQTDKTAPEYAALAAQAEDLGFDGVSVFHDFGYQPSIAALLEMARATSRVRLGAACINPYTLHPLEIAGQAAALHAASGGRAYVGIARGAWLDRVGVLQDRPLRRLAESIDVVRRLLAGDDSGYDGSVFQLAPGVALHQPPGAMPVLLGTWGARGLALAGRAADEVKLGGCANPDMVRLARDRLDQACRAAGRNPASVGLVAGAVTVVDTDGAAARASARAEVAMYLDVVAALDETVDLRPDASAGDLPDDLLRRFAFAGTPDDITAQASALAEAGAARIEFGTPHGDPPSRGVDLLGRHVLPSLAGLPSPADT